MTTVRTMYMVKYYDLDRSEWVWDGNLYWTRESAIKSDTVNGNDIINVEEYLESNNSRKFLATIYTKSSSPAPRRRHNK